MTQATHRQDEQLVPDHQLAETSIKFTKQENGERLSRWCNDGTFPYPFSGMEEIINKSTSISLAVVIDGVLYQLQTVTFSPTPTLHVSSRL